VEAAETARNELEEAVKVEKKAADRAGQMQKMLDELNPKLMIAITEQSQSQIKL